MPIYEYKCKSCDSRFETLRPVSQADAPIACPQCEGSETMRLLSVFAAQTRNGGSSAGEPCATSEAWGGPCCRTFAPGGG